jgi:hypothetical protein
MFPSEHLDLGPNARNLDLSCAVRQAPLVLVADSRHLGHRSPPINQPFCAGIEYSQSKMLNLTFWFVSVTNYKVGLDDSSSYAYALPVARYAVGHGRVGQERGRALHDLL